MKVYFLAVLLFGFVYLSSDDGMYVKDLDVCTDYYFGQSLLYTDHYFFRVAVSTQDNMYLDLGVRHRNYDHNVNDFKFDICGYNGRPSDEQVKRGHEGCVNANVPTIRYEGDSAFYRYTFQTLNNVDYLAFCLTINTQYNLPYYLYINSANTSWALIICVFIFLPCIIIAAVVLAILKFCCGCGCRIRVNSGPGASNII